MGELAGWMDEGFIRSVYQSAMNENVNVKIIRDRHSGYGSPHSQRHRHLFSALSSPMRFMRGVPSYSPANAYYTQYYSKYHKHHHVSHPQRYYPAGSSPVDHSLFHSAPASTDYLHLHRNAGYCFVEFQSPDAAQKALQLNGTPVPNSDRQFRLNWASGGGLVDRRDDRSPEYSIFVGDLGHEVNEFVLVALFQARFASCKSAKIMTDQQTGQSRGYGFVRFSDEQDQQRALVEMQGVYCGNRPMRVSPATPKNR